MSAPSAKSVINGMLALLYVSPIQRPLAGDVTAQVIDLLRCSKEAAAFALVDAKQSNLIEESHGSLQLSNDGRLEAEKVYKSLAPTINEALVFLLAVPATTARARDVIEHVCRLLEIAESATRRAIFIAGVQGLINSTSRGSLGLSNTGFERARIQYGLRVPFVEDLLLYLRNVAPSVDRLVSRDSVLNYMYTAYGYYQIDIASGLGGLRVALKLGLTKHVESGAEWQIGLTSDGVAQAEFVANTYRSITIDDLVAFMFATYGTQEVSEDNFESFAEQTGWTTLWMRSLLGRAMSRGFIERLEGNAFKTLKISRKGIDRVNVLAAANTPDAPNTGEVLD